MGRELRAALYIAVTSEPHPASWIKGSGVSGHMWREEQRLASRRRHSPRSTTHLRRLAAVRWFSPRRSSEQLQREITALLRYCGSRDRVAALLRLRSALVLCSPRPHREFAVPTTTPTFLPSALSHLRGYRYVDTACLCKGGFVWAPTTAFVCLPSITAGRAAPTFRVLRIKKPASLTIMG